MNEESCAQSYEEWHQIASDVYFSKKEIYALDWGLSTDQLRVIGARFGGPIAVYRDDRKVVLYVGAANSPDIFIYSACGKLLGRIVWGGKGRIVQAGWTFDESLVVVADNGHVHMYDLQGHPLASSISLGSHCELEGVTMASITHNSLVVIAADNTLWCVEDLKVSHCVLYPSPQASQIHCMSLVPPSLNRFGQLEIILAVDDTVVTVTSEEIEPKSIVEGALLKLAVSPCGKFVAGFNEGAIVYVWTSDLTAMLLQLSVSETETDLLDTIDTVDCPPQTAPDTLAWCGSDGVLLCWEGIGILLIDLSGASKWWNLNSTGQAIVSELDSARIFTDSYHYLIRQVPNSLVSVLEIGSTSSGALLYDARKLYESGDARATAELLEILRAGQLMEAVAACSAAAAAELDPEKQTALMRAACYGQAFRALDDGDERSVDLTEKKKLYQLSQKLRILNALHDEEVAIPLTMPQLNAIGTEKLLDRLVLRGHYLLALKIAEARGHGGEKVLTSWACEKIKTSVASDEDLSSFLLAKLQQQPHAHYAEIACHAQQAGRPKLALVLLEHEPHCAHQIPLLLDLGEEERALAKALESGDADLVSEVVFAVWRRSQRSGGGSERILSLLIGKPSALTSFIKHHPSRDLLVELYAGMSNHDVLAELHLKEAISLTAASAPQPQINKELGIAKDCYARTPSALSDSKFEANCLSQFTRLMDIQRDLEESTRREGFLQLTVAGTIRQCLKLGLKDQAQKVGREFKVPDKHFLLLSIETYASMHDWQQLQHIAGKLDKRSFNTIEAFITTARTYGAPTAVVRTFVDKLTGEGALQRRAQLYSELGMQTESEALLSQAELSSGSGMIFGSLRDVVGGLTVENLRDAVASRVPYGSTKS